MKKLKDITLVTVIFSIFLNINAVFIIPTIGEKLFKSSSVGIDYLLLFFIGILEIISLGYLFYLIKDKYSKNTKNSKLVINLAIYLIIFITILILSGIVFGMFSVLISTIFKNLGTENIKSIINFVVTVALIAEIPIFLWCLLNIITSRENIGQILKNSINSIKNNVYIKLLIACVAYTIIGYIFTKINIKFLNFTINILLQTSIFLFAVNLMERFGGKYAK